MKKLTLYMILTILLTSLVFSLGVTPARNSIIQTDQEIVQGKFKIINDGGESLNLVIMTRGELAKQIKLDERRVSFQPGELEKIVTYTLELPQKLDPGEHLGEIVISEEQKKVDDEDTVVGATLSVVTQINVNVPYPGKYAIAKLNIKGARKGEDIEFKIPIINKGEFDLDSVYANIDIYSDLNQKIDSFNTPTISIKNKQMSELVYNWKANVDVGNYKAIATLIYDGESLTLEDTFQVGFEELELEQINVNDFQLGEIVKMELLVKNKWSEDINNVHTQVQIFSSGGDVLADFNSPDETIEPLSKKVLTSYWDTAGVIEGTYDTTVTIHYGNKLIDTDLQLVVKENSLEVIGLGYVLSEGNQNFETSDNLVMILIIIIGILVLVNLLWFFILRKYLKKK